MVGHHLYFRGDMFGRGILGSYEGVVALNGGKRPGTNIKTCGWAPTENPMIWLADGGLFGNPDAETLEIRKVDAIVNDNMVWGWGNLECGNLTIHGTQNIIQAGQSRTNYQNPNTPNVVAIKTITFKRAFKFKPSVIITPNNQNNQDKKIYFEVTDVTTTSFTVKSYEIDHIHQVARVGNRTAGGGGGGFSPLYMQREISGVIQEDSNPAGYVNTTDLNVARSYTTSHVTHVPITAYFYWQAVAQTQYTVDANPPSDIEVEVTP
jgi:hypothetical protein